MDIRSGLYGLWVLFFAVWMIWGITAKRIVRRQSTASRAKHSVVLMLSFWLLFSPNFRAGPLGLRVLSQSRTTEIAAVLMNLLGFGIAIWARLHLGGNWSATVTVKENHGLIQSGPYAFVRHPIYSGISLAALGLAILNGDLRSFAALGLMLFGWRMKFSLEEQFMIDEFGEAYQNYKRRIKAIVPFVW
jgi:protein-S-isoprenylcysteine O-methyltransferase Ste14